MRPRSVIAILFLAVGVFTAVSCGPRPLTEKEICGAQGCQACTGLSCSGDGGTDAGP